MDDALQVVSITPDAVAAGRSAPARLLGAGFQAGASVRVGNQSVGPVDRLDENTLTLTIPALSDGVYDVTVALPDGRDRTLRSGLRVGAGVSDADACRALVVYFALDQASLAESAREALDQNLNCYRETGARLRIEGHADERGTTDYNVALALRRADAVRMHLVNRGVTPSAMSSVSWGEERPADAGHDERAWGRNRRVEIHLER